MTKLASATERKTPACVHCDDRSETDLVHRLGATQTWLCSCCAREFTVKVEVKEHV